LSRIRLTQHMEEVLEVLLLHVGAA